MAGTPAYMAPELLKGSPFSRKVDTYAFGVVLWEIIMRAVPFHGWEAAEVRDFVLRGDRLDLPRSGCHKACIQLIERCWAADQGVRPEFSKIAKALARIRASVKEVSHIDDATSSLGDSFDALSTSVHRSASSNDRKK
jgi:serine/threonine protein kinase